MGLWFFQGALLSDKDSKLINAQKDVTQAMRQWRFPSINEIEQDEDLILQYVHEAIINQKEGREIKADRSKPITVPKELTNALRRTKGATAAFRGLRPGLQREYAEYIASAKRDDTKARRIDKILPMIAKGAGLNDKYK